MNRNNAAFALLLAVSFSGMASAAIQTDGELRAMLAHQGYSEITDVKRDGDNWMADAKAAGNGLKLKIASDTGIVYPDPESSQLSPMDVLQSITEAGYTHVGAVSFYGGVWQASAVSSTGQSVTIKVDPRNGDVIDEKER
jgi:hypothetical protein